MPARACRSVVGGQPGRTVVGGMRSSTDSSWASSASCAPPRTSCNSSCRLPFAVATGDAIIAGAAAAAAGRAGPGVPPGPGSPSNAKRARGARRRRSASTASGSFGAARRGCARIAEVGHDPLEPRRFLLDGGDGGLALVARVLAIDHQQLGVGEDGGRAPGSSRARGRPGPPPARRSSGWRGGAAPRRQARSPARLRRSGMQRVASGCETHDLGRARRGLGGGRGRGRGRRLQQAPRRPAATTSGTLAGSRPFSFRLYLTAMAASMSCTTATKRLDHALALGGHRRPARGGPRG